MGLNSGRYRFTRHIQNTAKCELMMMMMMRYLKSVRGLAKTHQTKPSSTALSFQWATFSTSQIATVCQIFDVSDNVCHMVAIWLVEKVAH